MLTTITARHCEISDALRARAESVLERLAGYSSRPVEASVIFDQEAELHQAEIRFHLSRGDHLVAKAEAADHRSALDKAEERLKRQLEKAYGRPRRGRKPEADAV